MSTAATIPTFSGQSQYAASLQQVINRAVGIASLPLDSLEATLNDLTSRQSALQGLQASFAALQSSISSIQTALTSQSLSTTVSDASIVSANVASGAQAGNYSIEVDSLGSYSNALSNAGSTVVTDPTSQGISSGTSLTLNINGVQTAITAASGSLDDLAGAINAQAGDQVQATVVNVGSTASPDYRLSLTAAKLGEQSIDLTDSSGNSLIASSNLGELASYKVAGQSTTLTSDSRTVTLGPGLTVNLLGTSAPGVSTTITVGNDPSALAQQFAAFAGSYNAAVDILAQYHGQGGGSLEGDSIINTLTGVLQQLSNYSNGSPETALANYGITVDDTGLLSVDTAAFTSAANANFSGLVSVLGGTDTGGFLKTANDLLNSVEDPTTGTLTTEENTVSSEIYAQNNKISAEQAQVNQLQANITAQMVTADAAISALESQVSYVNGLFFSITGNNNNPNASASGG
jgi:flagellar hook-associated protein 2